MHINKNNIHQKSKLCLQQIYIFFLNKHIFLLNLLINDVKWNVNEVTLYQINLKLMKRKILYYPPNDRKSYLP